MARRVVTILALVTVLLSGALRCGGSSGGGGSSSISLPAPSPTPVLPSPPPAPAGLAAVGSSDTEIQLSWNDLSGNEFSFHIDRSTNGVNFSSLASVSANVTSYGDVSVTSGPTYWYRVRASNSAGYSGWSNIATATAEAANAWRTMGGNARHTGYNAVETGTPPLTAGWSANLINVALRQAVAEDGRVFVTPVTYFAATAPVWALEASTGNQLWNYNFGNVNRVGHAGLGGGLLFVPQNNQTPGTFMWAFNPATGNLAWATPMSSQWSTFWSPVYAAGSLWANGGYYGGLYGFNASDGSQLFFTSQLEQYDEWSPAYFDGTVYTFVAGNFRAHDPSTGAINWTRNVTWNWAGWSMRTSPVIEGSHAYVISPPNLHAINLSTQAVDWSANATFSGTPAIANGAVYAISGGTLQSRNASGLSLNWSFAGDTQLSFPPVIAAGYVYVSSANNTYAVNASTGQQAWTAAVGGWLSIAEGRLYVARPNGTLQTYVLTP